jgi:hypothetical protein
MSVNSAVNLGVERTFITQFILTHVFPDPTARPLPMADIFAAYKRWRPGRTCLTVDGFGRMFPNHYRRKVVGVDQGTCRAVLGVRLK